MSEEIVSTLSEPYSKIVSKMRLQSNDLKRIMNILIHYEFEGLNSPYEKIEKRECYFSIILETLNHVEDAEIVKKLELFLLTSYFVDKILTRYFTLQPFHSWRKNAICKYRDVRVKSITFFEDSASILQFFVDKNKELEGSCITLASASHTSSSTSQTPTPTQTPSFYIIPNPMQLQYRLRGTNIIVKNEKWSYIDYFSHYHGRYTITVDHFMATYNNTFEPTDLENAKIRRMIERRVSRSTTKGEKTFRPKPGGLKAIDPQDPQDPVD